MVKGVNKTVIEINDTGNRMFEKIVLYVTPEYGKISTKKLKREADDIIRKMDIPINTSLRYRVRKKQRNKVLFILGACALLLVISLVILL